MSPGNDNQVDWTASTTSSEGVVPGLSRPARARQPTTKRNVMDTLLGENTLAAFEVSGNDPYNTTGRQFRR